jgi:hypothetical protein
MHWMDRAAARVRRHSGRAPQPPAARNNMGCSMSAPDESSSAAAAAAQRTTPRPLAQPSPAAATRDKSPRRKWAPLNPRRLDPKRDRREWLGVRMAMQDTKPWNLGYGADHISPGDYDRLEAVAGWRLEAPDDENVSPWSACWTWRDRVRAELAILRRRRCQGWWRSAADDQFSRMREMYGMPLSNEKASLLLQGDDLHPHLNEGLLFHGTKKENLPGILADGFSFTPDTIGSSSGAAFGDGIYMCDRPGKADQYCRLDQAYDAAVPLHRQLYSGPEDHPGSVFYVLVCRVTLGYPALTRESKQVAKTIDQSEDGEKLFPDQQYAQLPALRSKSRKYLFRDASAASDYASTLGTQKQADEAAPPSSSSPIRYHSLFALRGKALRRYREFVVFHPHVLPAFLIAYQRKRDTDDSESVTVKKFGKKHEKMVVVSRGGVPNPGVFTARDVGCAIQIQGKKNCALWKDGELRISGEPRQVYWSANVPPDDTLGAIIEEVDPKADGVVRLSNGAKFPNPAAPLQPFPPNFRKTPDGRWKIRDRDEVRQIKFGDKSAEGRLSRLK